MDFNFKKVEDVCRFLKESDDWNSIYEHDNALEVALTPESIYDIFDMITKDTISPLIYESGCGSGITTAQICRHLSEREINSYKLVAHDVQESLVELARNRFYKHNRIVVELRTGFDYSDILDESVNGIFSLNTMIPFLYSYYVNQGDNTPYKDYLIETSRVLKREKPLVLTYLWKPLVLIKDPKLEKRIQFQIKLYGQHPAIEPFLNMLAEPLKSRNIYKS